MRIHLDGHSNGKIGAKQMELQQWNETVDNLEQFVDNIYGAEKDT